jgi:hypothetical protein
MRVTIELDEVECASCHTTFAMTRELNKAFLADRRRGFYCPQGHAQRYLGETEEQKLRRQLTSAQQDATFYRSNMEAAERSLSATKGVVTKLRKRVANGVCPFGCRRHFVDVQRHITSQHPGEKLDGEA